MKDQINYLRLDFDSFPISNLKRNSILQHEYRGTSNISKLKHTLIDIGSVILSTIPIFFIIVLLIKLIE